MQKTVGLSLLCLCLLSACGKKVDDHAKIPPGILEKNELAELLVDFALSESASNLNVKNAPIHTLDSVYNFDPLAERRIRQSQYDSSLLFYSAHPELYKMVYDTVLVRLGALKLSRNTIKADSTKR